MKRVQGLAIQAPSRPGVLGQIFRSLEDAGVSFTSLLAPDAGHSGIIHLIPDPMEKAQDALNLLSFPYSVEDAFILEFPEGKDLLGELITSLAIARINIEFIYTSNINRVIFATNDMERTREVVTENLLDKETYS